MTYQVMKLNFQILMWLPAPLALQFSEARYTGGISSRTGVKGSVEVLARRFSESKTLVVPFITKVFQSRIIANLYCYC